MGAQACAEAKADDTTARWYADVAAVTSAEGHAELLCAHEVKFGRRCTDPLAALAGAGRRVARMFPGVPLADALARWATEVLDRRPDPVAVEPVPAAGSISLALSSW